MRRFPRTAVVALAIVAGLAALALADAARAGPGGRELASSLSGADGVAAWLEPVRRLLQARDNDGPGHDNDNDNDGPGHDNDNDNDGPGHDNANDGPGHDNTNDGPGHDNDNDNDGPGHDNDHDNDGHDDHGPGHSDDSDDDNDGIHDNEDDDAYEHDPTLNVAGIQDCKAALEALSLPYAGATVFCPRASGMLWLAKYFGFTSTAAFVADIAPSGAGSSRAAAEAYFKLLVSPDRVLTHAQLPLGLTVLPTLLGNATGGEAAVRKTARIEHGFTRYKLDFVYLGGSVDVEAFDLTFEGPVGAAGNSSAYIVYALEYPVAPAGTYRASGDLFKRERRALSSSAKLFKASLREKKRGGVSRAGYSAAPSAGVATVLLPSNAAWQSVGSQPFAASKGITSLKSIRRDKARKAKLLAYLTLPGDVRPGSGTPFAAAGKPSVASDGTVTGAGGDTAKIVSTYVAGRYVVHAIDRVVVPADF